MKTASRLCAPAHAAGILPCQPVNAAVEGHVRTESLGAIHLRGFRRPHLVFRIRELVPLLPAVPDRRG